MATIPSTQKRQRSDELARNLAPTLDCLRPTPPAQGRHCRRLGQCDDVRAVPAMMRKLPWDSLWPSPTSDGNISFRAVGPHLPSIIAVASHRAQPVAPFVQEATDCGVRCSAGRST
jgi:hypothetical protein